MANTFPVAAVSSAVVFVSSIKDTVFESTKRAAEELVIPQAKLDCETCKRYLYSFIELVTPVMVNVVVFAPLYNPVLVTFVQVEPPFVLSCHW